MLKKNWKNLFRKTILDRGYGYYLEGAVEDISRDVRQADFMRSCWESQGQVERVIYTYGLAV